jgi:hypothetical protein
VTELPANVDLQWVGKTIDATEKILREMQQQLKAALDNAQRDRELAHRAIARTDQFEARLDAIAADIRTIRGDIASIDIKLAALPLIEVAVRGLTASMGADA